MPDIGSLVGTLIDGLLSVGGSIIGTAVGAVMSWFGSVINALALVAAGVMELLPDATDLGIDIPSGWLVGYAWLNSFLPLSEAVTWIGLMVAASLLVITWRLGVTIYHLIPKPWMGT